MRRSSLRPQRCPISTCISGSAPTSSSLVPLAVTVQVSGWQPPVRFSASSAGTSAPNLLSGQASKRGTTNRPLVD